MYDIMNKLGKWAGQDLFAASINVTCSSSETCTRYHKSYHFTSFPHSELTLRIQCMVLGNVFLVEISAKKSSYRICYHKFVASEWERSCKSFCNMGSILDKKNIMMEKLNETVTSFGGGPRKPLTRLVGQFGVLLRSAHSNDISNIVTIRENCCSETCYSETGTHAWQNH